MRNIGWLVLGNVASFAAILVVIEGALYWKQGPQHEEEGWQRKFRFEAGGTLKGVSSQVRSFAVKTSLPAPLLPETNDFNVEPGTDYSEVIVKSRKRRGRLGWSAYNGRSRVRDRQGRIVFDVGVTNDGKGRRTTVNERPEKRTRYALVFGGSTTFGFGVEDRETLPSRLAAHAPGWMVYNYGIPGDGIFETLALLKGPEFRREIPQAQGVGIYYFLYDHVRRIIPSSLTAVLKRDYPWFWEDRSGEIRGGGPFRTERPIQWGFYNALAHSQILRLFGLEIPGVAGPSELRFAARLLKELRDQYVRVLGNDNFVVMLRDSIGEDRHLTSYLDQYEVKYLDYRALDPARYVRPASFRPADNHPTAQAYEFLAAQLARDLEAFH